VFAKQLVKEDFDLQVDKIYEVTNQIKKIAEKVPLHHSFNILLFF